MPSVCALERWSPASTGLRFLIGAAVLCQALFGLPADALAQHDATAALASSPAAAASAAANPADSAKAAARSNGNTNKRKTKPLWDELTPAQQQSLAPLAASWDTISKAQKRKWLALSENFPTMSGAEQAKLHSRMTEWAALSPHQRTQARLNFAETQQLSPDDKKAMWEAYQALPPEEKRKLAATAPQPPDTAAAVKPVPPEKLADVPKPKRAPRAPRNLSTPAAADQNQPSPQLPGSAGDGRAN